MLYKDIKGKYLDKHCVVLSDKGRLYSVVEFEVLAKREYFVKCRNGYIVAYFKPEQLTCVDSL